MIQVNERYGCLTVLDDGEEYLNSEIRQRYVTEYEALSAKLVRYRNIAESGTKEDRRLVLEQFPNSSFMMDLRACPSDINSIFDEFVEHGAFFIRRKMDELEKKLGVHYKCQCRCGKICYYNAETIERKSRFCHYPIYISTRHTYSVKAQNARWRKQQEYAGIESVVLCDKSECIPKSEYCGLYNKSKRIGRIELE